MVNAGINDGYLVLEKEQNNAEEGQIVVAIINNEVTLKQFYKVKGKICLHLENA